MGRLWRRALGLTLVALWAAMAAQVGAARGPAHANGVVWWVPTAEPDVALTFDDGPDPVYTPQVLAELRAHRAVATFFVIGARAERNPGLVRAEAEGGSEVCGHGWTHVLFRGLGADEVRASVRRTSSALQRIGVPSCALFRFPYFASDATARQAVQSLGLRLVGAGVDSLDWQRDPAPLIASRVLGQLQAGDIVLLHDGGGRRNGTVQALNTILDALPRRGLQAVTVSQLLASERDTTAAR